MLDLSGGERRRLQLLRLLAGEPNVLLLDEPTNDLDIDTLASLEDLLDTWPGTMVIASHDRYLVERVCDTVYGMYGDGRLTHLPGGIDDYLSAVDGRAPALAAERTVGPPATSSNAADSRAAKKELARLERLITRLEQRESRLHDELAAHATDHEKLTGLVDELAALQSERSRAEESWLEVADQVSGN